MEIVAFSLVSTHTYHDVEVVGDAPIFLCAERELRRADHSCIFHHIVAQTFVHAFDACVERMASERARIVEACAVVDVVVDFLDELHKVVVVFLRIVVEGVREGETIVFVYLPLCFSAHNKVFVALVVAASKVGRTYV